MTEKQARKPQVAEEKPIPRAISQSRVINMAHCCGDPMQVVLEDQLDPLEVLRNEAYWKALPVKYFSTGARLELTNDAGTYLFEIWVRAVFGTAATGIRGIRFHHRVVWDERADAVRTEIPATGRWEHRYDGRFYRWRVYRPNGVPVETSFNDEGSALLYLREQEANWRP